MRGKDSAGRWREPFDPLVPTSPLNNPGDYTEANAWQYTLTPALHDPQGLVGLMGGALAFEAWLDRFFSVQALAVDRHQGQEALIGQYAHGNEPSHHIAYLYAFTGSPWKGHALIQRIVHDFYGDAPDGITGNDDCGQMSAWLVFATLGLYPVVPASGAYVLGAPQVRSAVLRVPGAPALRMVARGYGSGRPFAREAWLNGQLVVATSLPHAALVAGGELRFTMAPLPRP
jgi:predicted alpha-1,2-mannosidase